MTARRWRRMRGMSIMGIAQRRRRRRRRLDLPEPEGPVSRMIWPGVGGGRWGNGVVGNWGAKDLRWNHWQMRWLWGEVNLSKGSAGTAVAHEDFRASEAAMN